MGRTCHVQADERARRAGTQHRNVHATAHPFPLADGNACRRRPRAGNLGPRPFRWHDRRVSPLSPGPTPGIPGGAPRFPARALSVLADVLLDKSSAITDVPPALEDAMGQPAAVIDLEEFRRRREARSASLPPSATHAGVTPTLPAMFPVWLVWVPVWVVA